VFRKVFTDTNIVNSPLGTEYDIPVVIDIGVRKPFRLEVTTVKFLPSVFHNRFLFKKTQANSEDDRTSADQR
jgi:hypothetical protein